MHNAVAEAESAAARYVSCKEREIATLEEKIAIERARISTTPAQLATLDVISDHKLFQGLPPANIGDYSWSWNHEDDPNSRGIILTWKTPNGQDLARLFIGINVIEVRLPKYGCEYVDIPDDWQMYAETADVETALLKLHEVLTATKCIFCKCK